MPDPRTVTIDEIGTWPLEGLAPFEARLLRLTVPPGLRAPLHHHDGWQLVLVTEGALVSQMGDGQARSHLAGEAWFEQRGEAHRVFANETDAPAAAVVVYLTEPGRPVLTFDPEG